MKKAKSNVISYVVIALVAVLAVGGAVAAYTVSQSINVAGDYNNYEAEGQPTPIVEDMIFGSQTGPDLYMDSLTLGPGLSQRLSFGAGATTTPGGLFRFLFLQRSVCKSVVMDLTTAPIDTYVFAIATSTERTTWSNSGQGIIASTTVATSTDKVLDYVTHVGSSAMKVFEVNRGEYLMGSFDSDGAPDNASSTDYSAYAKGSVYLDCVVANN